MFVLCSEVSILHPSTNIYFIICSILACHHVTCCVCLHIMHIVFSFVSNSSLGSFIIILPAVSNAHKLLLDEDKVKKVKEILEEARAMVKANVCFLLVNCLVCLDWVASNILACTVTQIMFSCSFLNCTVDCALGIW